MHEKEKKAPLPVGKTHVETLYLIWRDGLFKYPGPWGDGGKKPDDLTIKHQLHDVLHAEVLRFHRELPMEDMEAKLALEASKGEELIEAGNARANAREAELARKALAKLKK